jgi:hypothetical protein
VSCWNARKPGRVLPAGDALAAQGGDKGDAGDGERPWRGPQTQEVVKVVCASSGEGGTLLNFEESRGVRGDDEGGVGGEEGVLRVRLVVRGGPREAPGRQ